MKVSATHSTTSSPDWAEALRRGLAQLTARQRLIVALRSCEGFGVTDIAAALDLSPEATRQELGAALRALERVVDESGREKPGAQARPPGAGEGGADGEPALPAESACEGSGLP